MTQAVIDMADAGIFVSGLFTYIINQGSLMDF